MASSPVRPQLAVSRAPASMPAITRPADRVIASGSGLQLPRQLPFEQWVGIGRQLSAACTSAAWCLGDWLAFGQRAYTGRYRQAIEQTSLDWIAPGTLEALKPGRMQGHGGTEEVPG